MIIFELLKNMSDNQLYLSVIIQYNDECDEATSTFEWDKIPKDIFDIYDYVNSTSVLEIQNDEIILYGNHIGRYQNHKYVLTKFIRNPYDFTEVKAEKEYEGTCMQELITNIADTMRIVKFRQ